ncbi:hypothetical protein [Mesoaciditoga lauensis]|uniref:hypothetical protein n=1 Tax=Mesoaciditoga lauensis TaxID=1495039 RepID=UPI00055D0DE4|nr:hypothetical protein [Mesoaciditoga lauensis]
MRKSIVMIVALLLALSSLSFAVSFNFQDTDLRGAIEEISRRFSTNIIVSSEVSGLVNASFETDDVEEALRKVLLGTNYTFAKLNNAYLVGGINSPDESHAVLFKTKVIFLKDTYPATVYDLLGTLSKYVVYSPHSMMMIIDADEETTKKIMNMISQIDVPNSNRFFSYEIHELSDDEYQRFRQFERSSKSGILGFSNASFDIFKEIVAINGDNDTFGTVVLPKVGNLEISSSDPSMKISVMSRENLIASTIKTAGNAIAFEMNENKNNHTVVSLKDGNKRFLVIVSTAQTPKEIDMLLADKKKNITTLTIIGRSTPSIGLYSGEITYGSTALSIISEGSFSASSTPMLALGLKANLIDKMYGTVEVRLRGTQPAIYGKIEDTTSVGFFKLSASIDQELTFNGLGPLNISAGIGVSLWNYSIVGGLRGEWNLLQPYIEASVKYDWMYASLLWEYTESYTFGLGATFSW